MTEECPLKSCILEYEDTLAAFQSYDGDKTTRNGATTSSSGKVTLTQEDFLLPAPSKLRLSCGASGASSTLVVCNKHKTNTVHKTVFSEAKDIEAATFF